MSKKTITLTSREGASFEIDEAVAFMSQKISDVVKDDSTKNVVPLPNVKSKILALVIEYCKKHVDGVGKEEELKEWDTEFMKLNDQETLYDLMIASYDLNIKSLVDLTCKSVADMIRYKTVDEIRGFFKLENDLTPEEAEEIRRDNRWAFG